MYNLKNLIVIAGGAETGDGTIDVADVGAVVQGWELVIFNGSGNTITLTVRNISISIPDNSVLDEAFSPFTSFTIAGSASGSWSWYVRG